MNVLFLTYHTCIRALKESFAVMNQGHGLYFLQAGVASEEVLTAQPFTSFYKDTNSLAMKLPLFGSFDLIHVHNEPNWMVRIAKEILPNTPVVMDCHDLNAIREGVPGDDEEIALRLADGLIFPSKPYMDATLEFYKDIIPSLKDKPRTVVYSMCNAHHIVETSLPRIPGIVYEGAMVAEIQGAPIDTEKFKYRNYVDMVTQIINHLDIPVHLYGVRDEFWHQYVNTGAVCHRSYPYSQMLNQISRYDWGFCGSPLDHDQWHMAMPNKLFDYLAAGIPVIVYKADECAKFIMEHGLGIVINDLQELGDPDIYDLHLKLRPDVQELRHHLLMEMEAPKIFKIYQGVMEAGV